MAISVTDLGTATSTDAGSNLAISGITVPAGAMIYVMGVSVVTSPPTTITATDSAGDTFIPIFSGTRVTTTNTCGFALYCKSSLGFTGGNITVHSSLASADMAMSALYATGFVGGVPTLDPAVTATTNGAFSAKPLYTLTSGAPSVAGELFVQGFTSNQGTNNWNLDTGNGWAHPPDQRNTSQGDEYGGWLVNAGTGTKIAQPSNGSGFSNIPVFGWIVGFKPVSLTNTKSKPFVQVFI
jgi:hypothetical protein